MNYYEIRCNGRVAIIEAETAQDALDLFGLEQDDDLRDYEAENAPISVTQLHRVRRADGRDVFITVPESE